MKRYIKPLLVGCFPLVFGLIMHYTMRYWAPTIGFHLSASCIYLALWAGLCYWASGLRGALLPQLLCLWAVSLVMGAFLLLQQTVNGEYYQNIFGMLPRMNFLPLVYPATRCVSPLVDTVSASLVYPVAFLLTLPVPLIAVIMKAKKYRTGLWMLFAAYCLVMVYLLFLQRLHWAQRIWGDYWAVFDVSMQLVPFKTIGEYLSVPPSESYGHAQAVKNLVGNVVMFVPLGFFLPALFEVLRKLWRSLLYAGVSIVLVELIQLFTLLGSCDVDDFILNMLGAAIGYGAWRLADRFLKTQKSLP